MTKIILLLILTIEFCNGFNEVNEGCFFDTNIADPTFLNSVGILDPDATPYHCYLGCLKQDFLQVGRPITIGMTSGNICLCGLEAKLDKMIEVAEDDRLTFCSQMCTNEASVCGGPYGAISVYSGFPNNSMSGLSLTAKDARGRMVNGSEPEYDVLIDDEVYMEVIFGSFYCHASKPTCVTPPQDLPPVEILVDYGDGSGIATWSRENMQDLWRHKYARAGTFTIVVTVIGVYDKKVQKAFIDVTVTESVLDTDQVEIYCPDVIHPGEYFNCRIDIPTGEDLQATVSMKDDLTGDIDATEKMHVPDLWMDYPGGNVKLASYNNSAQLSDFSKGYVLPATMFGNVFNITALEFVAVGGAGQLIVELVRPTCGNLVWCSLTRQCEKKCESQFETLTKMFEADHKCEASATKSYCSFEETCNKDLKCPKSISDSSANVGPPEGFEVIKEIWSGTTIPGSKQIIKDPFKKAINDEDTSDENNAHAGYKTHEEEAYPGDLFLAFRCAQASSALCAKLPYEVMPNEYPYGAMQTTYQDGEYTEAEVTQFRFPLRVRLQEDRILNVEKKFFCDRTTEKTVTILLEDPLANTRSVSTRKVSCQYDLIKIEDLSSVHPENTNNNTWHVTKEFPTPEEIKENQDKGLASDTSYHAQAWVRENEELRFHVKFSEGSHVRVEWKIEIPNDVENDCKTVDDEKACTFPFRYQNILYYGCARLPNDLNETDIICATSVDSDYNALQTGNCNEYCHQQYPRPEETEFNNATSNTVAVEDNENRYNKEYIKPLATEIELVRKFKKPGTRYDVVMFATNMHNPDDYAEFKWHVYCAHPVVPEDWTITYDRFQHSSPHFTIDLTVAPEKTLPTMPIIRIIAINGDQRIDNNIEIDNSTIYKFAIPDNNGLLPNNFPKCDTGCHDFKRLEYMGITNTGPFYVEESDADGNMGLYKEKITLYVPVPDADPNLPRSFGFNVQFYNEISSIKYTVPDLEPYLESLQVLDPAPAGTGEWVTIKAPKWDFNWVEFYVKFAEPFEFSFGYTLPNEFGEDTFYMDFSLETKKWYIPAAGYPYFNMSVVGTPRRVQYTFNNTDITEYQPPPCFIDWPEGAIDGTADNYGVKHCPNLTEGTYDVVMSGFNPVDGWFSSKPSKVEVLSRVGPITIDDFLILSDYNETKRFNIRLGHAGQKTCIVVDYGDDDSEVPAFEYFGNPSSCRLRFPEVTDEQVQFLNIDTKTFDLTHVYYKRGLYKMHVFGFDERNYAESFLDLTIFRLPCNAPMVWIPNNQTSYLYWDKIPTVWKSKGFQTAAKASVECNVTTPTYMEWKVYKVDIIDDEESQIGKKEVLEEIQINTTVPSYNRGVLNIPPLTLREYGLHKLVFRFDIETYEPTIPFFKEAFTYVNITKSPLQPVLLDGSPSKVSRGWTQTLTLFPEKYSIDPDFPDERNFNYTWFCRVVSPDFEEWKEIDKDGFPVYQADLARGIPRPSDALLINPPPGCFGNGPQPIKSKAGILGVNTASLVTYSRIYEILLILSKDTRRAMAKIELDLGAVPAPIAEIKCVNSELCFPTFGGVFVNPTSRLALKGACLAECIGDEAYRWDLFREEEPLNLNTTYCGAVDAAIATTTTPATTTGTTTTTTTTAPEIAEILDTTVVIDGQLQYASTQIADDETIPVETTVVDTLAVDFTSKRRRRKREAIRGPLPPGCKYVYADGSSDARDSKELSIQQKFFDLQDSSVKDFVLKLNITKSVFDGRSWSYSYGTAYINIFINDPPENGTCRIQIQELGSDDKLVWVEAKTGRGLLDEFRIDCSDWVDPNDHVINKFVFKIVQSSSRGEETTMLYSGPLSETKVIFPVGEFRLYAEIHEEAGAFSFYEINPKFSTVLPDEADYAALDIKALLKEYNDIGDQARVSQILLADASIRAKACWFNATCVLKDTASKDYEDMDDKEKAEYQDLIRTLTNANTDALTSAKDSMSFENADQLEQGSSTLYSITSNLIGSGPMSKTLDMQGREAAVDFIEKMSEGFKKINVPDPNKITAFIEGITGSAMAIMDGLNNILYSDDPTQIPLTDFEAAADLPYDTDIPEGDADIPTDPEEALRKNALKLTRIRAIEQVKKMTSLVDEVAETTIKNSVVGETLRTKSPLGVQMIMSKMNGKSTVGRDLDGDGIPDVPLRYEFDSSRSVVQFPLGFCPSAPVSGHVVNHTTPCEGQWGFVFKEWETITATYPTTAQRLNLVTKQMDIDIYEDLGGKLDVKNMEVDIIVVLERMETKNKALVEIPESDTMTVDAESRLSTLKARGKPPLIYHQMNVTHPFSTINVQFMVPEPKQSRYVILARHSKMPTLKNCDFVKIVSQIPNEVPLKDGSRYMDWFIDPSLVKSKTKAWYFGLVSVKIDAPKNYSHLPEMVTDLAPCASSGIQDVTLDWDWEYKKYTIRMYTAGTYYFDDGVEVWDGKGITVMNTTNLVTAARTNHLTSFATGFFPQPNTIDFKFVFAQNSFSDNLTIFLLLIISFSFYLLLMIWAIIKDIKDDKSLPVPFMRDNHPDDKYLYEIIVETGPNDNHATTSTINFILSGSECDTEVRCFSDDERHIFKKAARDGFLMSVPYPLGSLEYFRVWTDSSGLGEMSAWYIMSIMVHDVQTGEITRFIADQWLALDRGTFEDDITIPATMENEKLETDFLLKAGKSRVLTDDHLWWSIFTRPFRSRFNRKERVSVAFAFLFLSFLVNAMWYGITPEVRTNGIFQLDFLPVSGADCLIGFLSNLIVFPPLILMVLAFKKSKAFKKRKNRVDRGVEFAVEKQRFRPAEEGGAIREETEFDVRNNLGWPPFVRAIGWILCLACIGGGAFLVVSYGLSFGNDLTYQWVTSMLVSFFSSMIITQPIKILFVVWVISYCIKKTSFNDDHCFQDEQLPTVYYKEDDPTIANRPKIKKPPKKMMDPLFYQALTQRKNQEQEMKGVLRDIVTYLIYIGIILIIVYGQRDQNLFLQKQALETAVIFGGVTCEIVPDDDPRYRECTDEEMPEKHVNFMNIKDMNEYWKWINDTVIQNVRVQNWYNGKPPYGLRGYLDDRVNRIIGYAIIRQTRERQDSCKPAREVRDTIEECTGEQGKSFEETGDFCEGWLPEGHPNCSESVEKPEEYKYVKASDINARGITGRIRSYSGGGYILKLKGYIDDLHAKMRHLQEIGWADNRTRSLMVEFSVYNAQVNIFAIVTTVAEFVGGGVWPYYRVETFRLFSNPGLMKYITLTAQVLFIASTFYYIVNLLAVLKKDGFSEFTANKWNLADCVTIFLSIVAIGLWVLKTYIVMEMNKDIEETKGNEYIRLTVPSLINEVYEQVMAFTIFFSTLKFSKQISFHKAFMQISATIRLCFIGLSTFVVEFAIVFCAFSGFFFFVLKNDLENFRDFTRTLMNTMAMSIGKFNFGALRAADEMAAWIFFVFSIVVNMILINMMMAIINLAFEEIKANKSDFQSKFDLLNYVKRTTREMVGLNVAEPIVPVYVGEENQEEEEEDEADATERISENFTQKTDRLLDYITRTYLADGFIETEEGKRVLAKMSIANGAPADEKKVMEYGFDAIFMGDKAAPEGNKQ